MRLSDLRDKVVRSADGQVRGRVHDVHCVKGELVALKCGPAALIERWTSRSHGHHIPWEAVAEVGPDAIMLASPKAKPARRRRR